MATIVVANELTRQGASGPGRKGQASDGDRNLKQLIIFPVMRIVVDHLCPYA